MNRLTKKCGDEIICNVKYCHPEFCLGDCYGCEHFKEIKTKLEHYEDLEESGQLFEVPKELVDKKNFIPNLARAFTNYFCPSEFGLKDGQCGNWRPYDVIMCYRCWEMALNGKW